MPDIVDVVAEAICNARSGDIEAWEITYDKGRERWRQVAQAAIDSLGLTQFWAVGYGDGCIDGEVNTDHLDSAKEQLDEAIASGYPDAHLVTFWATGYSRVEVAVDA